MSRSPNVSKAVGICGGTGSGKSTLVKGLQKALPNQVVLIQQDDYLVPNEEIPKLEGWMNYEHPKAWDGQRVAHDIAELRNGRPVKVYAKDHSKTEVYGGRAPRKWVTREPKPIVLVEGFLILAYPEVRGQLAWSFFLQAPFEVHMGRRIHFINEEYRQEVLEPMHAKYVESKKRYANEIVPVGELSAKQVLSQVLARMKERGIGG